MKSNKIFRAVILSIMLSTVAVTLTKAPVVLAQTQDAAAVAIQRGYRTGYSDGYMAGYRDTIDSVAKSYDRHAEYSKADRAYSKAYGSVEDYRDGYKQGFETGYTTGYDRRSFEANLPTGLKHRGLVVAEKPIPTTTTASTTSNPVILEPQGDPTDNTTPTLTQVAYQPFSTNAIFVIPNETELILELQDDLNTEQTREGQKFTAKVVSPSELAGATIEGRVAKLLKPGRIKRRSEMLLSFDRIVLNEQRWSNFNATLTEVLAVKGDNVSRVDNEGTAVGKSSLKSDAAKVGGATGIGLVTGAVIAGPAGAAVGAGMGAAFGVGAVVIERGKHIRLNRNQQLRIKTDHEIQIR